MEPRGIQDEHPAFRLKNALRNCMYRNPEPNRRFTTTLAIQRIWPSDAHGLREQLGLREGWSDEELAFVDEHLQKITCIFAWITISNFSRNLRRLLPVEGTEQTGESNGRKLSLRDTRLPLPWEECSDAFGPAIGQDFFDNQFLFAAISINQFDKGIVEQSPESRFPFLREPTPLASGAYGDVFEVTIVKGQLRSAPDESNDDDRKVAFKRVRQERDWMREVKGLDILKESISRHDRLTLHLAAIIQGNDFYLFLPLAKLGDLELLLQEGTSIGNNSEDVTRYDFQEVFPEATVKDFLHEFATLTGAINFLHNHVSSRRNVPVYCAHVDLRPKNVLVFPPEPGSPIGVWKISDFGISSFRYNDGRALAQPAWTQFPSIGDVAASRWHSSSATSSLPELIGPHRAPELSIRGYPLLMPAIDIWSLGCILCEILVFSTGDSKPGQRKVRLNTFRHERQNKQGSNPRDDSFYEKSYESVAEDALSPETRTQMNFMLRPKVDQWLKELSAFEHCDKVVSIIRRMLHPVPDKRLKSKEVFNLMQEICSNVSTSQTLLTNDASVTTPTWSVAVRRASDGTVSHYRIEPEGVPSPNSRTMAQTERQSTEALNSSDPVAFRSRLQSQTLPWIDTTTAAETRAAAPDISTPSSGYSRAMNPYDPRRVFPDPDTTSTTSSRPHRDRQETPTYPVPMRARPSGTNALAVDIRANLRQNDPSPPASNSDRNGSVVESIPDTVEPALATPRLLRITRQGSPLAQLKNFNPRRVNIPLNDDVVVYLCKVVQDKKVFSMSRRNQTFELRLRKRSDQPEPASWQALPLPPGVDWSELSIRSGLAAILGTDKKKAGVSHLSIFDLKTLSTVELPLPPHEIAQLQKVSCTHGQQLAFCKAREAILWRRGADPKRLPSPSSSNLTHGLINAQFSHDAGYFFAWWGNADGDRLQIWDLKSRTNPFLQAEFTISRSPSRMNNSFIVPCGNLPGCILRDSQGTVSTALALRPSNRRLLAEKQVHLSSWGFPQFRSLCCATDSQLFYVDDSSKIKCHTLLISNQASTLTVELEPRFDSQSCPIDDATAVALQKHPFDADGRMLRVANLHGAIYELELGE